MSSKRHHVLGWNAGSVSEIPYGICLAKFRLKNLPTAVSNLYNFHSQPLYIITCAYLVNYDVGRLIQN